MAQELEKMTTIEAMKIRMTMTRRMTVMTKPTTRRITTTTMTMTTMTTTTMTTLAKIAVQLPSQGMLAINRLIAPARVVDNRAPNLSLRNPTMPTRTAEQPMSTRRKSYEMRTLKTVMRMIWRRLIRVMKKRLSKRMERTRTTKEKAQTRPPIREYLQKLTRKGAKAERLKIRMVQKRRKRLRRGLQNRRTWCKI